MIKSKRTFNVTVKHGNERTISVGYAVLGNNILDVETIVSAWMLEQDFINPEIVSITQTGDILVREED